MKRVMPCLLSLLLTVVLCGNAWAEGKGQEDLDKATELQLKVESLQDVEQVIGLCESALRKGLDEDSREFAKQLLVGALWQRASQLASAIFDQPRPHRRWQMIRRLIVSDLEKLIEYDDKFRDAYLLLARLQALPQGNETQAKSAIDRAIELSGNDARQKSEALLQRSRMQSSDEARLADLNAAIESDPTHADAWQVRAAYFIERGEMERAIHDFQKLLEKDADNVAIHQALAEALGNLERFDLALEHLEKAIELAPQQAMNYTLRARIHEQRDEHQQAITDLNNALELEPDNPFALLSRAHMNYLVDDLEGARADVERVLQARPGSVQGILLRSMIAAAERRFRDAIADLQMILREDPSNVGLQLQLASFYIADERPTKAIKVLTAILEADQDNWMALRTRADALLSVGKHSEAIEDYNAALKLQPKDDGILNNLAWVLATSPFDELRDGERAIELAKRACEETNFERPHILSTLAAGYAEAGDFETAIKWSKKAVEKGEKELKDQLEQLQQELESYEKGEAWRELQEIKDKPDPPRHVIET